MISYKQKNKARSHAGGKAKICRIIQDNPNPTLGKIFEGTAPVNEEGTPFPISDYTDLNFFETFRDLGVKRDFLDFFAQHSIGSIPSLDAERIQHFCKHNETTSATKIPTVIQLHDREYHTNESRQHPKELTPVQLRQALSEDRFGHANLSDASRRQILVKNLDVKSLQVLAETAACHQVVPLRDAMSKHISGETSFKVRKQIGDSDTPFLELHLPYLALRKAFGGKPAGFHYNQENNGEPHTSFFVPNFADLRGKQDGGYVIHEAQISILLCIWDHSKWVAYAFSRPCPSSTPDESDDQDDDVDGSEDDAEECGEILQPTEDIFAPDNGLHNLSGDQAIWDPRMYYLRITAIWVDVLRREYTYLVETLEMSIKAWKVEVRNSASEALCNGKQDPSSARLLNSTIETMQLLREVREHILVAIRAWDSFRETDLAFFTDLNDHNVKVSLRDIKSSFDTLVELKQKLVSLDGFLADSAKFLKLRLTLWSNETIRHAHDLNMQANTTSQEIRDFNRTSTEAAVANFKAAEKTSRITQISIMVIWITTPLLLVLQYFSVEKPIFTFERNTKTFIIAVCIVFLALPLLAFALHSLEGIHKAALSTLGVKSKSNHPTKISSDALNLQPHRSVDGEV